MVTPVEAVIMACSGADLTRACTLAWECGCKLEEGACSLSLPQQLPYPHSCRTLQLTTAATVINIHPESLCHTLQGDAAAALEKAQALCHRDNHVNMRHILEFLIPVHMLRGRLPPTELLERYNLQALKQISQVKHLGGAA